jgi:hypothetical protein
MRYPLKLDGFEGQTVEVQPAGVLSGPKLLLNGQPAPPGPKRGQMALRRNDGRDVLVRWRPQFLGLDVPQVYVDGYVMNVAPPLPMFVWLWSALPILLVLIGGALGALAGFVAFAISTRIFRSSLPALGQYGLSLLVSLLAVIVYLTLATLFYSALGGPAVS